MEPYRVAERLSPTNMGLLFNSRQAALEFGYLTVSEFVTLTENSVHSALELPRHFGHFLNWYDNLSRTPLGQPFVSSVDSGNLVASLWSLKQGCLEVMRESLFRQNAIAGLRDHVALVSGGGTKRMPREMQRFLSSSQPNEWLPMLFGAVDSPASSPAANKDWQKEVSARIEALRQEVRDFAPWLLPDYEPLRKLDPSVLTWPPLTLTPAKAKASMRT
jgi:cyclic beta-1,2-glucan synthetase